MDLRHQSSALCIGYVTWLNTIWLNFFAESFGLKILSQVTTKLSQLHCLSWPHESYLIVVINLLNSFILEMPGARNRLASKQQGPGIPCKICSKMDGENCLQCENCDGWTHSACMGNTKEELDFLERAKNVHFFL